MALPYLYYPVFWSFLHNIDQSELVLNAFSWSSCVLSLYSKKPLATDMCLSWPKVLNLVTVRGFMKTPV